MLCVICLHNVFTIFSLPVLWQDHLPSVICGQGQIKWHGVVPAGSVVPPKTTMSKELACGSWVWVDETMAGKNTMTMELDRILRLIFYLNVSSFEYLNPSPVFITFIVPLCLHLSLFSTVSWPFSIHTL